LGFLSRSANSFVWSQARLKKPGDFLPRKSVEFGRLGLVKNQPKIQIQQWLSFDRPANSSTLVSGCTSPACILPRHSGVRILLNISCTGRVNMLHFQGMLFP
jgi:hypothetical protein